MQLWYIALIEIDNCHKQVIQGQKLSHLLFHSIGVYEIFLWPRLSFVSSRHIPQHTFLIKRPSMVRADDTVMPLDLTYPALT